MYRYRIIKHGYRLHFLPNTNIRKAQQAKLPKILDDILNSASAKYCLYIFRLEHGSETFRQLWLTHQPTNQKDGHEGL